MMRIYIGYDPAESVAYHVLSHSIIRRTNLPVSITPIGNKNLPPDIWWRGRGHLDSTEFSIARFMTPFLSHYQGWSVFMDCDMLCLANIEELFKCADDKYAVLCQQHQHVPNYTKKFLGQTQTQYRRKNWSSLILFNNAHPACRSLTPEYVNRASGLELHRFEWCPDDAIGTLPEGWNTLIEHKE